MSVEFAIPITLARSSEVQWKIPIVLREANTRLTHKLAIEVELGNIGTANGRHMIPGSARNSRRGIDLGLSTGGRTNYEGKVIAGSSAQLAKEKALKIAATGILFKDDILL